MKKFKSSVGGFKKSDVNNYIIELDREYALQRGAYEDRILELKRELEVAKLNAEKLDAAEREAEALRVAAKSAEDKISELTGALASADERSAKLISEIDTLKVCIADREDALSQMADRVGELEEKNAELMREIATAEESAREVAHKKASCGEKNTGDAQSVRMSDVKKLFERLVFAASPQQSNSKQCSDTVERLIKCCNALEADTARSFAEFKKTAHELCRELKCNPKK